VLAVQSTSQTPEGSLLSEGSDLETKYIAQYRNCIRQQQEDTISYNLFWKPIQNRLSDSHTFFISSDGVYNQINLNVLRNPASHQYVLDEVNIYLVTNTKDILQSTDKINMASASLFGKPDYTVNTSMNPERPNPNRSLQAISDRDLVNFTDQDFDDLPGTELEVKSIESVFLSRQWSIHTFLNENATEENIKSVESPSVLHIATHGFFLEDDGSHINSMIRSGIILAGIKNHSDQRAQDGILTAYETTGLALEKTNLVVLSACETGLGEVMNGEGVYGLQRGLKVAGAKNLLMSLWKVDDKATAELMINFYQKWLSGLPIHDAFKKAQMDLRQNYESPFYWGAFILIGN
jgi:CHAT domain-containing protein